jgi:hypothetical protein
MQLELPLQSPTPRGQQRPTVPNVGQAWTVMPKWAIAATFQMAFGDHYRRDSRGRFA